MTERPRDKLAVVSDCRIPKPTIGQVTAVTGHISALVRKPEDRALLLDMLGLQDATKSDGNEHLSCLPGSVATRMLREVSRRDPSRADEAGHGTYSTYSNHCCRCAECKAAQATWSAQHWADLKAARPAGWGEEPIPGLTHGRRYTYQRYGCRCSECRAANAAYERTRQLAARRIMRPNSKNRLMERVTTATERPAKEA